jgi:hypothetical protein
MMRQILYSGPSLERLHEKYAKKGQIDEKAPIKTFSNVYIDAPVERVWELLVNLPSWPTIDPAFRDVRLESDVTVDARFHFVLNNFPIHAKFAIVNPNRELTWTGVSLWFKAVDRHVLEPTPDGGTRHYLAESFAGVLASLFISSDQLKKQHQKWLLAFKQAAEKP